jgi:hypothetical protein
MYEYAVLQITGISARKNNVSVISFPALSSRGGLFGFSFPA